MKMNKKITASVLAMTMGAGLVGSISGTVAWYQYSTRAQIGMLGMSLGVDRNLQVAVTKTSVDTAPAANSAAWTTEINSASLADALGKTSPFEFHPVTTTAAYAATGASFGTIGFKGNPIQYRESVNDWEAAKETDYLEFKVWVRAIERDGSDEQIANPTYVAKELGLYDATIRHIANGDKKDISKAVRVLISNADGYAAMANVASTELFGELDLDGNGQPDTAPTYSDLNETVGTLTYGISAGEGLTYNLTSETRGGNLLCNDPVVGNQIVIDGGFDLGATTATAPASFNVKIWLEGWAKLGASGSESAMWATKDYVDSRFFVGLTIASGDARQ